MLLTISKYSMTELCELAYKYGTDKCPRVSHSYTPLYHELLAARRDTIKKVVEVGIGEARFREHTGHPNPQLGASLRMWRDYFPNAFVYGVDIVPETMFEDERIKTFLLDEKSSEDMRNLVERVGADVDLFVDDGSHDWHDQVNLCRTVMPLLKPGVVYCIEDVRYVDRVLEALKDYDVSLAKLEPITTRHRRWNNIVIVYHTS